MKKKVKLQQIFSNNKFMLRYIVIYGKSQIFFKIIIIFIDVLVTFVNINMVRWILDSLSSNKPIKDIILLIVMIGTFHIANNLFISLYEVRKHPILSIQISHMIMKDIIIKVGNIDQINFENKDFYNNYTRALNEVNGRAEAVLDTACSFVANLLKTGTVIGVTSIIDYRIPVLTLISSTVGAIITHKMNKINYKSYNENTLNIRKCGYVQRLIYQPEFSKELKLTSSLKNLLLYKYAESIENSKSVVKKYIPKLYALYNLQSIINNLLIIVIPWIIIVFNLYRGNITVAETTVLMSASSSLSGIYLGFLGTLNSVSNNSLYIDNIRTILEHQDIIEDSDKEETDNFVNQKIYKIEVCNMAFAYNATNKYVFTNINLVINQNDKIAIVGLNGAGKTTLTMLLARIYDVTQGEIKINGKNIREYNINELRKHIAILNQDFKIYSFSIAENILMKKPMTNEDFDKVETALKKVGLYDKVMQFPNGYNTYMTREFDNEGVYFSGGELQKLALARIYASKAELIILDEPTSALDPISESEIVDLMSDMFTNRTVLIVSHRLSAIKKVDRILYISNNIIIEEGSHNELFAKKGEYFNLYMAQASKYNDI